MPRLSATDRKKAEEAEVSTGFSAFPPGKYIATLEKVETRIGRDGEGNPYWNIEVKDITDLEGKKMPGRLWDRIMLPIDEMPADYMPKKYKDSGATDAQKQESWDQYQNITAGRIKGFFEAFGFTVDSDTDEMLGEKAVIRVGVETVQQGKNAGQERNVINGWLSLDSLDSAVKAAAGAGPASKAQDDF